MPRDLNSYREAGYALEDRAVDAYHSLTGFHPVDKSIRAGVVGTYVAGMLYALQMVEEGGFDPETARDTILLAARTRGLKFNADPRPLNPPETNHPTRSHDHDTAKKRNLLG